MRRVKFVLLVVMFLAVCVVTCRPWGDDVVEDGEEAKHFAAKAVHDVEEETRSWADWAQDKFSKYFSFSLLIIQSHIINDIPLLINFGDASPPCMLG